MGAAFRDFYAFWLAKWEGVIKNGFKRFSLNLQELQHKQGTWAIVTHGFWLFPSNLTLILDIILIPSIHQKESHILEIEHINTFFLSYHALYNVIRVCWTIAKLELLQYYLDYAQDGRASSLYTHVC